MATTSVFIPLEAQPAFFPGTQQQEHECPFCGASIHQDWLLAHLNARHPGWPEGLFRMFWGEPGKKKKDPGRASGAAGESAVR